MQNSNFLKFNFNLPKISHAWLSYSSPSIKALISSSSLEEWFNIESVLPTLSDNKDIESSGDLDLMETLDKTKVSLSDKPSDRIRISFTNYINSKLFYFINNMKDKMNTSDLERDLTTYDVLIGTHSKDLISYIKGVRK